MSDFSVQTARPPFDTAAQERIAALFRSCSPSQFLDALTQYVPSTRDEHAVFEKYYGWSLIDSGEYRLARDHLARALRLTRSRSRDRSIVRGLLSEQFLHTGKLDRAERCAHRALAQPPESGEGAYLRSGHLNMLARIHRRRGHIAQAIDTYRRALAAITTDAPHWTALTTNLVTALVVRGDIHEADALTRQLRLIGDANASLSMKWAIAHVEARVAIQLGQLERAEQVLDDAIVRFGDKVGPPIEMYLLEVRAEICRARGEWAASELILQSILDRCEPGGRHGDVVASAARGLAESLEGQHRYEEALGPARLAVREGSAEDQHEWARALHVLGRCLAALGRDAGARRAFQEALGLHERAQFEAEYARLLQTLSHLGLETLRPPLPVEAAAATPPRFSQHDFTALRVALADGRVFQTLDPQLLEDIRTASSTGLPVLIEGETGTGKELVAHLIHEQGPLARGPFVVVHCAMLSAELADVELFGAARGATPGAHRDRPGILGKAEGGTLFLDELPELSTALQAKLLRVLQEGVYRRVGEDTARRAQVRFAAATNRSVSDVLRNRMLEPDLFYRLNGHRIRLKPLRERREEIRPLADDIAQRCGLAGLTPAAYRELVRHDWPGNVRELEMLLRVSACGCRLGERLDASDLALPLADPIAPNGADLPWERRVLLSVIEQNGGNIARTARAMGLTRQALVKALQRTGITLKRARPGRPTQ